MRYSRFFWIFLFGFYIPVAAQQKALDEMIDRDCMGPGSASVLVYDLDKQSDLYAFDDWRALPTASIQKMLTTAAVLSQKGPDYHYVTRLGYRGNITGEVLDGDLVILGSGDPTLGSDYFSDLVGLDALGNEVVDALKKAGIHALTGNIRIHVHSVMGQHVPGGWSWSGLGNYYGAGHWGLNINDNEYKIYFRQNEHPGQAVSILRTIPSMPYLDITSEVVTGPKGSGDQAYIYAAPYATQAVVRGSVPPGKGSFSIRGSIPNPPLYFGQKLSKVFEDQGIAFAGTIKIEESPPSDWIPLLEWNSPSLFEMARVTNYRSVNLYAEALMKLLCDNPATIDHYYCGLKALRSFWEEEEVDMEGLFLTDGSGLSARNTASARGFIQALQAVYAKDDWYESFSSILPKMGRDGTLKFMLRGYNGPGFIFAKSGYIGRQRSYAGYITTESGRHLAFCIILDNYTCSATRMRQKIEKFLIALMKE